MTSNHNHHGQPVGVPLPGWKPPPLPSREAMEGRYCTLEPLTISRHAADLYAAYASDVGGRNWTYLPYGPFGNLDSFCAWMDANCLGDDPLFFAIVEGSGGKPLGLASYLRIAPSSGSIEVGHIHFSENLKKTRSATESIYLMMRHVFGLGYRRFEWKCDALNAPSRAAAERLGFSYEGTFRQATVYKGRSRDTAWYAMIDADWPALQDAFQQWLSPGNFDGEGRQRVRLRDLTRPLLRQTASNTVSG